MKGIKLEIDTDTFFLTSAFATNDLKARMEELKDELEALEVEHMEAQTSYHAVQADLSKMEQKAIFVRNELVKNVSIFTPPPEDANDLRFQTLLDDVFTPLQDASIYLGGGGSVLWAVGAAAPKVFGVMGKMKGLGSLGKAAKSAKWAKLAKVGRVSGVLSVALFAVEAGLRMHSAAEINAHFKTKSAEIARQVELAQQLVDDLHAVTNEATALRQRLLDEGGFANVAEYTQSLNEAIAALGRQRASLTAARRMLMEGLPEDMIARFVPDLPVDAIAALALKLRVEKALLEGRTPESVAESDDASLTQVQQIARIQNVRLRMLEGGEAEALQVETGLPEAIIAAEEEVLATDLRQAWGMLKSDTPPLQIAQKCLFSVSMVEAFEREHDAKELLYAGQSAEQAALATGALVDDVASWDEQLTTALASVRSLLDSGQGGRIKEIAAELRVPLSLITQG